VEAAVSTARELSQRSPSAVLNIGIAGARGVTPGGLVVGSEAVYIDISAEIPVLDRVEPDSGLLASLREAIPEALVLPIGTSATVGRSATSASTAHRNVRVEGMEGFAVLRACALAGIPAAEVRAISNEITEGDRSRWRIGRALEALADVLPRLIAAAQG
jgi:nucleoside phosphorylase